MGVSPVRRRVASMCHVDLLRECVLHCSAQVIDSVSASGVACVIPVSFSRLFIDFSLCSYLRKLTCCKVIDQQESHTNEGWCLLLADGQDLFGQVFTALRRRRQVPPFPPPVIQRPRSKHEHGPMGPSLLDHWGCNSNLFIRVYVCVHMTA